MTVRLVAISTYDSLARLVAFIALNHLVLCAFKVKEDPFLHIIVLVDPFLSFSFQHPGCFFLLGRFHVTHVIFRKTFCKCRNICDHTRAVVSICFCSMWWNTDGNDSTSDRLNCLGTIL